MASPFHRLVSKWQKPNALSTFHITEYVRQNRRCNQLQRFYEPFEEWRNSGGFHISPGFSMILELYEFIQKKRTSCCCHVGNPTKFEEGSGWTVRSSLCLCNIVQEMLGAWPKVIFLMDNCCNKICLMETSDTQFNRLQNRIWLKAVA